MIKDCAHFKMEYVSSGHGVTEWQCVECLEVFEEFLDCTHGR
jgi:hypothetical protein